MPSRNAVKIYVEGGAYHIYNRGVEKRDIFRDSEDYAVFRSYLRSYLLPPGHPEQTGTSSAVLRTPRQLDLFRRVTLLAYCLMPNHFHLLLRQQDKTGMTELMRRLSNAYVEYFNRKWDRVGALFQGRYKAVLLKDDSHLVVVSRYIHRNPLELIGKRELGSYTYSSYPEYVGGCVSPWLHPSSILGYFSHTGDKSPGALSYQHYVEYDLLDDREELGNLALE